VPCVLGIQAGIGFKPTGEIRTREGGGVDGEKVKIARQSDGIHDEHEELLKSLKSPPSLPNSPVPRPSPRRTSLRAPLPQPVVRVQAALHGAMATPMGLLRRAGCAKRAFIFLSLDF
jgi:hypothetical protein